MQILTPVKPSFTYDLDSNQDDLSSSLYSSKMHSTDSNYFLEYLQQREIPSQSEDILPEYNFNFNRNHREDNLEKRSTNSVIRF